MNKLPGARCSDCPLRSVEGVVPGYGPTNAEVIFVGEAPGRTEQAMGVPFVGQSGKLLDAVLEQCGVSFPEAFMFKTNVVACQPPGNREPTNYEIACCAPRLGAELAKCTGRKVVTLGKTAHEAFGVPHDQIGAVFEQRSWQVMPCWHPAYILRAPDKASEFVKCIDRAVNGPFNSLTPDPEVRWMHTAQQLRDLLAQCPSNAWVSLDIESDNVRWFETVEAAADPILMLQLAWDQSFALIIGDEMLYDVPETVEILREFLARVRVVGQNIKFDAVFLKAHLGLSFTQSFDTMLAHYLLDENSKHGLKDVARLWLGIPDYEKDTIQPFLTTRNDYYSKVPPDILAKYGAMDVVVVLILREIFEAKMQEEGILEWPFEKIIMPAANMFVDTEILGMQVDLAQLDWLAGPEGFGGEIERLTEKIREIAMDSTLNPNSSVQLSKLLYDELKLPVVRGRKIKPRSTGKEALEKLRGKHPIIEVLGQYRRVAKMTSTYVLNLRRQADVNARVHGTFNIPGTEIGRLSVSRPALQTIPRASDYYGSMIRSAFVAPDKHLLAICDYSQAELRIAAAESGESFLIDVYANDRDLHSEVAIGMYGKEFTKEQRVMCKMFNFSYLYGGTEYSFAQDAGLDINIARQFVKDYNRLMPTLSEWKVEQFNRLKRDGYVKTRFGRKRRFPLLTDVNSDDARKSCVHMPIAASANDLTLLSGIRLASLKWHVVLEVHDSVLLEIVAEQQDEALDVMSRTMIDMGNEFYPEVVWKVDPEVRTRWAYPKERGTDG